MTDFLMGVLDVGVTCILHRFEYKKLSLEEKSGVGVAESSLSFSSMHCAIF